MRETPTSRDRRNYARPPQDGMPEEPKGMGFDGWLVVMRAFTALFAGLLLASLAAVI